MRTPRASMSEITALRKFPCPACGAEAVWNPAKKVLACPYCGTNVSREESANNAHAPAALEVTT